MCASRNYFCVSISKSEQRAVLGDVLGGHDFQLSGQVVGCVEIICRGKGLIVFHSYIET